MSTQSIERAARAFVEKASGVDEWGTLDAETQGRLLEAVRAALSAIREPNVAAIRAGAKKSKGIYRSSAVQAEVTWRAMIDATIKEH